jgi:hypothetical protein
MQAGLPSFVLSPGQWVEKTNAIAINQMKSLINHPQLRKL